MGFAALIFAGALAAQAAAEAPAAADAAPKAEAPKAGKPKQVCVVESQIGSHRKRRYCVSQEEWDKRQDRDQQMRSMPVTKPLRDEKGFKNGD